MKRTDLIDALELVSPALAANNQIPVLSHFWFRGDRLMAYNDQISISTSLKTDFQGAVPSKFLDLLKSNRAENVELSLENDILLAKAASTKLRLALLPSDSFVFDMPKFTSASDSVSEDLFAAIDNCMRSVSTNNATPEQLGITLIPNGDELNLYSTNDATISTSRVKAIKLEERVSLSESFCKQMLSFRKEKEPRLEISSSYSLFSAGKVMLFGRLIDSGNPLDFKKIIDHHTSDGYEKNLVDVEPRLKLIMERAMIITDTNAVDRKPTLVAVKDPGRMTFYSKSDRGECHDVLKVGENHPRVSVRIEPKYLRQGCDFSRWTVTNEAVIMTNEDESLMYLIGVTT